MLYRARIFMLYPWNAVISRPYLPAGQSLGGAAKTMRASKHPSPYLHGSILSRKGEERNSITSQHVHEYKLETWSITHSIY